MKLSKLNPMIVVTIAIVVLVALAVVLAMINLLHPNPLSQYTVSRQCDFIQFADLSAAVCADGTTWLVSTLKP